jgi:hypothetical protein
MRPAAPLMRAASYVMLRFVGERCLAAVPATLRGENEKLSLTMRSSQFATSEPTPNVLY